MRATIDALREMYRPPSWATGHISTGDAEFLVELVQLANAQLIVELGVASGASSAALLFALDRLPDESRPRSLVSIDTRSTCYFDAKRAVGAAVDEMYPDHHATWTLVTHCDARAAAFMGTYELFDLAFVDADHAHPWPLFDVLTLAPALRPGAWIALHDIALARLYPQYQSHGPQWLFETWPGKTIAGRGDAENIGAVQLPLDLRALVPVAHALLGRRWEAVPPVTAITLAPEFAPISALLRPRLRH